MHRSDPLARIALGLVLGLAGWLASATPARADQTVVVAAGESLTGIAARHATTVAALVAANGLASADLIRAGQVLRVPSGAPSAAPSGTIQGGAHLVAAGETLTGIALRYGTTVHVLLGLNGLASADLVLAGQTLRVPAAGAVGAAVAPVAVAGGATGGGSGRRIVVSLAPQRLVALEGDRPIVSFPISSGAAWTPTPVGRFQITARLLSQRMVGPGYDIPDVPHVQYFTGAYALHGAPWHNDFGVPRSHGCVNLRPADAAWLWSWAGLGTEVLVQP